MGETGELIDLVRSTRDADVAALFKEQQDGKWRVSLRSRSRTIGHIARERGGGGHDLAAGYTVDEFEIGVSDLLEALRS
jgi:phosphoesterase RecJ-like protein